MKCPYCGNTNNKVVDKRETENNIATRRRRECSGCSKRFTTYERIEGINLIVIKKNGTRVAFDKTRVEKGIMRSCEKRPLSTETKLNIADEVESELINGETTEIKSTTIGRLVMKRLRKLDKVAYIRFASVYRDFEDVNEFHDEISKLIRKKKGDNNG